MPSTRQTIAKDTIPSALQQPFHFPPNNHLLITTPRHIFAWDESGVRSIFHSTKAGIVAAREAKDGSGVLAVAGRHVVVLHDTKRGGKEESWGLSAPQDEVRHLEYSKDAKSLFLSTTIHGDIQHYSVESSRLLDPAQKHASSPVALALSSTGHILLSASQDPPVVHVKNLAHNTVSHLLQPNASASPVSCATFHPERPNIFALAFRDGTVAAYDASKISRKHDASQPSHRSTGDPEISHLSQLHRVVVSGDQSLDQSKTTSPIVDMAFLPGFKTRAVTAGQDGRCRFIDFSNGGVVLRTWHAKAPLTSVSVLAIRDAVEKASQRSTAHRRQRSQPSSSHTIGGPTSTSSIIALGRIDGKVQLYDTLGLLLSQKRVSAQEDRILSIEWVRGPPPTSLKSGDIGHFSDTPSTTLEPSAIRTASSGIQTASTPILSPTTPVTSPGLHLPLDVPPSLHRSSKVAGRQFTVHPDEMQEGTVRYMPSPQGPHPAVPRGGSAYHDLFSPIKAEGIPATSPPQKLFSSPPRSRPRISSQTFVKSPDVALIDITKGLTRPSPRATSPTHSHATSSSSYKRTNRIDKTHSAKGARRSDRQVASRSIRKSPASLRSRPANIKLPEAATIRDPRHSANARVLAELRKLATGGSRHQSGLLSAYASSGPRPDFGRMENLRSTSATEPVQMPHEPLANLGKEEPEIWLTSESEDDPQQRRRPRRPMPRPPGRQTSRSRVGSRGTMSTTAASAQGMKNVDLHHHNESTEDGMVTAHSRVSPVDEFYPGSEDVRELFPRSSSLSPRKDRSAKGKRSTTRRDRTLTNIAVNSAFGRRQPKSPWARAKAAKPASNLVHSTTKSFRKNQYVTVLQDESSENRPPEWCGLIRNPSYECLACPEMKARMQDLEGEVAHLKGEVLALKAALRQNGLPFPACLR